MLPTLYVREITTSITEVSMVKTSIDLEERVVILKLLFLRDKQCPSRCCEFCKSSLIHGERGEYARADGEGPCYSHVCNVCRSINKSSFMRGPKIG